MDGQYPDDQHKKSGPATQPTAPHFAVSHPPEDEDLYLPPSLRHQPKWHKMMRRTLGAILIVVILAAVVVGVYGKFFYHKQPAKQSSQPSAQTNQNAADPFTNKTKTYTSTGAGLSFAYPETWKLNDANDKLTVTSPVASLTDMNGAKFSGKIVFTVQPKGTTPKAFDGGGVIAALDSQKISYAKPTSVQRGQTYLSFLQYTQALVKDQLDGIYVTGDFGYQTNQYAPKTDITKLDPLITVTFQKCDDDTCASPTDTSIQASMWSDNADFQKTIEAFLKSIQVSG